MPELDASALDCDRCEQPGVWKYRHADGHMIVTCSDCFPDGNQQRLRECKRIRSELYTTTRFPDGQA